MYTGAYNDVVALMELENLDIVLSWLAEQS